MTSTEINNQIAALDAEERIIRDNIKRWFGESTGTDRSQLAVIDAKRWPLAAMRDSLNRTI